MRLGAANQDKLFTGKICVHSHDYSAFIDTGSQAILIRQSVAEQINAKRHKCSMKTRGICGGSCILTEAMTVDMDIDGKTITAKVYIADNDLLQEDFLLGQDVIISAHLEQVVAQAPYRVFEAKKEIVSRMVDELLKQDIITL